MKKRGRMPNEHTYTIMLEGFSNAHPTSGCSPVKNAWTIYQSITASNSKVARNIIHTNAMLSVCLNHSDMKMLWQVLEGLPLEGPDAPNAVTYTIVLNAIKQEVTQDVATKSFEDEDRIAERKTKAIIDAKRVWADVVYRWKKGALTIDNQLVHAMASVLIESHLEHDCYDVLALYNQTAKVPIYVPKPSSQTPSATQRRMDARHINKNRKDDPEDPVPFVDDDVSPALEKSGDETVQPSRAEEPDEENFDRLFDPVVGPASSDMGRGKKAVARPSLEFITPTNMDVQRIFQACQQLSHPAAAKSYWKLFTEDDGPLKIAPNHWTFHECLRLLRQTRSSAFALNILEKQMVPSGVQTNSAFIIAMSTVLRDRRNRNILNTANSLMTLMHSSLMLPEPKAVSRYLDLVNGLADRPGPLLFLYGLHDSERMALKNRLKETYSELKQRLRIVALKHLIPIVSALDEAMAHNNSERAYRDDEFFQKMPPVDAGTCLRVVVRTRALADIALKCKDDAPIPKDDAEFFDRLEKHTARWKTYSSNEMTTTFLRSSAGKTVSPTERQIRAFLEAYEAKGAEHARAEAEPQGQQHQGQQQGIGREPPQTEVESQDLRQQQQ